MKIEIKYFGIFAEITGRSSERLEIYSTTIGDLKDTLLLKYPNFKNKDFRIAQNQELVTSNIVLTGLEIAVLPPFAGG